MILYLQTDILREERHKNILTKLCDEEVLVFSLCYITRTVLLITPTVEVSEYG